MSSFDSSQTITLVHGSAAPTHAVIWLHGLGATADDFPAIVPHLGLASSPTIRFIFPQAPTRPISVNNGMQMPGWYDIRGVKIEDKEDLQGMRESQGILEALIDQQIDQGIASQNIVVAGFSQGGAVAYYTGIRTKHHLGGILALSTYLSFADVSESEQSGVNFDTPILAMHGRLDPVVPFDLGLQSAERLKHLGYPLEWHSYTMEHTVIAEQLVDVGGWINAVFASKE